MDSNLKYLWYSTDGCGPPMPSHYDARGTHWAPGSVNQKGSEATDPPYMLYCFSVIYILLFRPHADLSLTLTHFTKHVTPLNLSDGHPEMMT